MAEPNIPADVHPQVAAFLKRVAAANLKPITELSPPDARAQMEAGVRARNIPPPIIGSATDRTIPGPGGSIPVRIYRPLESEGKALPVLVYYHGGGHVIGSLDTHDLVARGLCQGAECAVVSVDYRMGPEDRFPAAVEDAWAAVAWVAEHGAEIGVDGTRIAVGGDSAGGNLATVVVLMARAAGAPKLCFQLPTYPLVDYRCAAAGYGSYTRYAKGYGLLEAETMQWFHDQYLRNDADANDWRASPILAKDLSGLPPALVMAAECDVLRDEGRLYADRLIAAGVPVEYVLYEGMIHAFAPLQTILDGADKAAAKAAGALAAAFAR